jgi:hypothetical protein
MSTVIVMVNGQQTFKATNKRGARDSGVVTWKQFKKTFVAAGGATTISFNNGGPANDNYNGLANVELASGLACTGVSTPFGMNTRCSRSPDGPNAITRCQCG